MYESFRVAWPGPLSNRVSLRVPPSKSELNRWLILAALRSGPTELHGRSRCDDVTAMTEALTQCGVRIETSASGYHVMGRGRNWFSDESEREIYCGEGGTTLRFLMALAAARPGWTNLNAERRLLERPADHGMEALVSLGAQVERGRNGFRVKGSTTWPDRVAVGVWQSSQFVSGLLLVAAFREKNLFLEFQGDMVSESYFKLSVDCVEDLGGAVVSGKSGVTVKPLSEKDVLREVQHEIEGDASCAAVWLVGQKLGWPVHIDNYPFGHRQADTCLPEIIDHWGETSREVSLRDCPDLAPVLAALGALSKGDTTVRGAEHLRHKESNRIEDLSNSFGERGLQITPRLDGFHVPGGQVPTPGMFDPRGDHRLAMAATLLPSRCDYVRIQNPHVVNKSYPEFWEHARGVGWMIEA